MRRPALFLLAVVPALGLALASDKPTYPPKPAPSYEDRRDLPDSYRYYGPNGLWKSWSDTQKVGRDTWIFWTGGNQKTLRLGGVLAGQLPVPVSFELFRLLDSRDRDTRFRRLGLVNEPNCKKADHADQYGLWFDEWQGDPEKYYPDPKVYGQPTGVVGLRKFHNPKFDPAKWDAKRYFAAPGKVEPPYLVGFSCVLCHIAFDPTNPPKDPEHPRWENLAANIGNQFLREGDFLFGNGRVVMGDHNPGPKFADDPYDTRGLGEESFLYHYAHTQEAGTSETSRISYDFINNPNTMNPIFYLGARPVFQETAPDGTAQMVRHVLKDGADSVGLEMALLRVWINIGCEGNYWFDHLFSPVSGRRQEPFHIDEVLLNVGEDRKKELLARYGPDFGQDWKEAWRRNPALAAYLTSYTPYYLKNASSGDKLVTADANRLEHGKLLFADNCARCHSNKQPGYTIRTDAQKKDFYRQSVAAADFLVNNTLSDDRRYKVTEVGTNMARALATNAVDGDIWAEFSSKEYKALDPVGTVRLKVPIDPRRPPIELDFTPPGGGRGYYRTPSLVSMWATAPYFHNNALGQLALKADGTPDVSVEARIKAFDDAVEKLLWPEKRAGWIKRTSAPSSLFPGLPELLPRLIEERLAAAFETELAAQLAKQNVPVPLAQALSARLRKLIGDELAGLRKTLKVEDLGPLKEKLAGVIDDKLGKLLEDLKIPAIVGAPLRAVIKGALRDELDRLQSFLRLDFLIIPAGTPINLYANLSARSLPFALVAYARYKDDPYRLAEELLKLSDCPDLVEDHGHEYGKELSDADKRDLIEFLKTL